MIRNIIHFSTEDFQPKRLIYQEAELPDSDPFNPKNVEKDKAALGPNPDTVAALDEGQTSLEAKVMQGLKEKKRVIEQFIETRTAQYVRGQGMWKDVNKEFVKSLGIETDNPKQYVKALQTIIRKKEKIVVDGEMGPQTLQALLRYLDQVPEPSTGTPSSKPAQVVGDLGGAGKDTAAPLPNSAAAKSATNSAPKDSYGSAPSGEADALSFVYDTDATPTAPTRSSGRNTKSGGRGGRGRRSGGGGTSYSGGGGVASASSKSRAPARRSSRAYSTPPDAFRLSPIADTKDFEDADWRKYDNPYNKPRPMGLYTDSQLRAYFSSVPGTESIEGPQLNDRVNREFEKERGRLEAESSKIARELMDTEKVESEYRKKRRPLEDEQRNLNDLIADIDKQISDGGISSSVRLRATKESYERRLADVNRKLDDIRKERNRKIGDEDKQREAREKADRRLSEISAKLAAARAKKTEAIELASLQRFSSVKELDKMIKDTEKQLEEAKKRAAEIGKEPDYSQNPLIGNADTNIPARKRNAAEEIKQIERELALYREARRKKTAAPKGRRYPAGYGVLNEREIARREKAQKKTTDNPYGKPPPVGMMWNKDAEEAYYKAKPGEEPKGGPQLPDDWLERYDTDASLNNS